MSERNLGWNLTGPPSKTTTYNVLPNNPPAPKSGIFRRKSEGEARLGNAPEVPYPNFSAIKERIQH
jgi:hypothetical protein